MLLRTLLGGRVLERQRPNDEVILDVDDQEAERGPGGQGPQEAMPHTHGEVGLAQL